MELLTVIPVDEIVPYGIPFIRSCMARKEGEDPVTLGKFWNYFVDTWMNRYNPKDWNLHSIFNNPAQDAEDIIINRTNNPLERYNRTMNGAFANAHPSMPQFVTHIRQESNNFVRTLSLIQRGKEKAPDHIPVPVPVVPDEYQLFKQHIIATVKRNEAVAASSKRKGSSTAADAGGNAVGDTTTNKRLRC